MMKFHLAINVTFVYEAYVKTVNNFPFHSLKILRARENERVSNINILLEFILSSN